ncbi:hypothetical protein RvY_17672 [Ramazzottius varieornatus]|uniref:R3H domain-containing protein n=1 Tax=Ramazzottius varieornatus TaxID=947166 RepID=A0A1D1W2Y3_RAMVA|nr:hypothetical protein RvY_17672 [Ramazzottius varieornatus]
MRDDHFDELVYSDVSEWLKTHDEQRAVLLFPPLLNRYRYRIHLLIQEAFPTLKTVSLGQEESRRTVVYPAEILIFQRPPFTPRTPQPSTMDRPSSSGKKPRPSAQPYVPPALRNHDSEPKKPPSTAKRKENLPNSATTKPSAPNDPSSESCPEPAADTISPPMYSGKRHAAPSSSTSTTPTYGSNGAISEEVTEVKKHSEVPAISEPSHRSTRSSKDVAAELGGLTLEDPRSSASSGLNTAHVTVQHNGTQKPPRGNSEAPARSVMVLRRPGSIDSNSFANPQTPAEHKAVSNELSDTILQELTAAFGESTTLYEPGKSYRQYGPTDFDDGEAGGYSHVLEAYDFPSSFVTEELTKDIQLITQEFFDLRWVDDTHALVIFSSDGAARRAYRAYSPAAKVKLRLLPEASEQGKKKARACAQSDTLSPFKHRPETSAAAARRMVAGALGIKIDVPKEKREQERRQLTDAKQEKVLTAKRKEDVWEGLV